MLASYGYYKCHTVPCLGTYVCTEQYTHASQLDVACLFIALSLLSLAALCVSLMITATQQPRVIPAHYRRDTGHARHGKELGFRSERR
jgi:hypothetical protein